MKLFINRTEEGLVLDKEGEFPVELTEKEETTLSKFHPQWFYTDLKPILEKFVQAGYNSLLQYVRINGGFG